MNVREMTIYSIFVRNHGGSFAAVAQDMPRIRALGVDAVWLMPIHPIGKEKRKGSLGSPYAISDYRAVNPEYGTLDDFRTLADAVHANGMKLLIDVVYNHTAPDSRLAKQHPEWFYHRPDGSFGNRVGDWSDIIDLDYTVDADEILHCAPEALCDLPLPGLWAYQIESLKYWARFVDGFRCDVAPLVPLNFWLRARAAVETVRPGCIWLAESVEQEFLAYARSRGMTALSDTELYRAFDICYDYDIWWEYERYAGGLDSLEQYVHSLNWQLKTYPAGFSKLRCLENHDRPRMGKWFPTAQLQRNWLSWCFFQQGTALLYSGQEWAPAHTPTLFDPDPIPMEGPAVHAALIRKLTAMKKDALFSRGVYELKACPNDLLLAGYRLGGRRAVGLFSLKGRPGLVPTDLPDGQYTNYIDGSALSVESGLLASSGEPVIILL